MKLQAGAATSNITPWLGVAMPGSFRPRYGEDVHDELLAKALVIDNGAVRIAMVTCDLIAIPEAIANAVKARIKERCGISPECVMVNATHTHSGAGVSNLLGVGEDEGYTTWLPLKVADAVELAVKRMQPARAGFASVMEDRISFYRRWLMKDGTVRMNPGFNNPDRVRPMGEIDPELAMMYVEGVDGTPISVVASFSLHYVGTGGVGQVSADYFGQFFNLMRHYLGGNCVPILWNAASGQINNNDYSGERIWQDRGYTRARRMANVLAGHVLTEIQLMDLDEKLALEAVTGTLEFSRKVITETDLDIAEQILAGGYEYEEGPFSWVAAVGGVARTDDGTRAGDPIGRCGDSGVAGGDFCGEWPSDQGADIGFAVDAGESGERVYRLCVYR